TNVAIAAGYHNGSGYVISDTDLISGNIKSGVTLFGVDGTLYNAAVPKTGITVTYTISDDGALEKGVAWPEPRFITGTTGIVTDTLTGLIWLTNANCMGDKMSWTDALTWSNNLADGECGLTDGSSAGDWRLPNRFELESLIHLGVSEPALPNTAGTGQWKKEDPFTNVQWVGMVDYYWSSSTNASKHENAWIVYMNNGFAGHAKKSSSFYVWPVRGGQ
ncbi:MAG: DUF1566 domain-containing protein, partial [Chloroflexi bacterium]|nr:DUF1566 domain-containing protein [Chloroflexota bacterium]